MKALKRSLFVLSPFSLLTLSVLFPAASPIFFIAALVISIATFLATGETSPDSSNIDTEFDNEVADIMENPHAEQHEEQPSGPTTAAVVGEAEATVTEPKVTTQPGVFNNHILTEQPDSIRLDKLSKDNKYLFTVEGFDNNYLYSFFRFPIIDITFNYWAKEGHKNIAYFRSINTSIDELSPEERSVLLFTKSPGNAKKEEKRIFRLAIRQLFLEQKHNEEQTTVQFCYLPSCSHKINREFVFRCNITLKNITSMKRLEEQEELQRGREEQLNYSLFTSF